MRLIIGLIISAFIAGLFVENNNKWAAIIVAKIKEIAKKVSK